jgi:hypothetical protein
VPISCCFYCYGSVEPIKKWVTELNRFQTIFQRKNSKWPKIPMKKCSLSLAIKEMQIKTTLRFYLTPVRIAVIKNTKTRNVVEDVRKKRTPINCLWECKLVQPLWKTICRLLKKLNIDLQYDLAIPLLGI